MELKDYVSITISFLALIISGITAYRTLFARFKPEIYVRPRVFLSRVNKFPCLVASCELSNQGARMGSIDDVIMRVKYRQQNPAQTTRSISTYTFLPTLIGEKYNIFNGEQESDFEPFQSIALSANARLTRFIVFSPSNEEGFVPASGEMELEFFSRNSRKPDWDKVDGHLKIAVDESASSIWRDPNGKSIMLEAVEHNRLRENLLEKISA